MEKDGLGRPYWRLGSIYLDTTAGGYARVWKDEFSWRWSAQYGDSTAEGDAQNLLEAQLTAEKFHTLLKGRYSESSAGGGSE